MPLKQCEMQFINTRNITNKYLNKCLEKNIDRVLYAFISSVFILNSLKRCKDKLLRIVQGFLVKMNTIIIDFSITSGNYLSLSNVFKYTS